MPSLQVLKDKAAEATAEVRGLCASIARYLHRARTGTLDARGKRQLTVLVSVLLAGVLVCVLIAVPLTRLVADPASFRATMNDNYAVMAVVYGLINTVHVFIAVIPGEPLELGAGYLFGTWMGLLVVSLGLGLGELVLFWLVRRFGPRLVHLFVSQEKLDGLVLFNDERRRNLITFLMMFIPGTPKDLMSYVVGLTRMRISTWMLISLTARVPSILISTFCGSLFAQGYYGTSALTFAVNIALSILGLGYYALINRQARTQAALDAVALRQWEQAGAGRNDANVQAASSAPGRNDARQLLAGSPGRNDATVSS